MTANFIKINKSVLSLVLYVAKRIEVTWNGQEIFLSLLSLQFF
jgi:hypothetical protein